MTTDEQLRMEIIEELKTDPLLVGRQIDVEAAARGQGCEEQAELRSNVVLKSRHAARAQRNPMKPDARNAPADASAEMRETGRDRMSPLHDQWLLDEALAETFPASDPISPSVASQSGEL